MMNADFGAIDWYYGGTFGVGGGVDDDLSTSSVSGSEAFDNEELEAGGRVGADGCGADAGEATAKMLYSSIFHSEEGVFGSADALGEDGFAAFYDPQDSWTLATCDGQPFATSRLTLDNVWPPLSLPPNHVPLPAHTSSPFQAPAVEANPPPSQESVAAVGYVQTPASRFMASPDGPGVIIPVAADVNRKQLQDRIATEGDALNALGLSPSQVYVGYVDGVATGTALLLIPPTEQRDHALKLIPGSRLALACSDTATTAGACGDLLAFVKPVSSKAKAGASKPSESPSTTTNGSVQSCSMSDANRQRLENESANRAHRYLLDGLRSTARLARLLGLGDNATVAELRDALIGKARILLMDAEHAVVMDRSHAVPVEIALVELGDEGSAQSIFHEFVHPGVVGDVHTAMTISTCSIEGGHGVPLDAATFLRDDYDALSEKLLPFLRGGNEAGDKVTILVNKGPNTSDLHAMRWVLAASNAVYGTSFDVSTEAALAIPMFDVSVLREVFAGGVDGLGVDGVGAKAAQAPPAEVSHEDCCWYHRVLRDPAHEEALPAQFVFNKPHCALQDARKLALEVSALLGTASLKSD